MAASWANQNPILRVIFAGWESDTYTLMRNGWEMAFHQDPLMEDMRVALRHKTMRLGGFGIIRGYWHFAARYTCDDIKQLPPLIIETMGQQEQVFIRGSLAAYRDFRQVEMEPQSIALEYGTFKMSDIPWFAEVGKPNAQELIIEPEDVQAVLDGILKAQAPGMREIRARQRKEEIKQVHAQIISLKAAA